MKITAFLFLLKLLFYDLDKINASINCYETCRTCGDSTPDICNTCKDGLILNGGFCNCPIGKNFINEKCEFCTLVKLQVYFALVVLILLNFQQINMVAVLELF